MNKPQYIGILEFSNLIMVDFHDNCTINKYGNNAKLLHSDTDPLLYHTKRKDIYDENYKITYALENNKLSYIRLDKNHTKMYMINDENLLIS